MTTLGVINERFMVEEGLDLCFEEQTGLIRWQRGSCPVNLRHRGWYKEEGTNHVLGIVSQFGNFRGFSRDVWSHL